MVRSEPDLILRRGSRKQNERLRPVGSEEKTNWLV